MAEKRIRAVTFDLWDCVFIDDSDEPKRRAAARPPKPVERRELVHRFLSAQAPIERSAVDLAYDVVDAAFKKVWHDQFVTWTVTERLNVLLSGLKRELPEDRFRELVRLHEEMELEFRPDPVPGVHEAVAELARRYRLGVISDAVFSPGRALRELLRGEGLLDYFETLIFSDEAGRSKPAPSIFRAAAEALGVEPAEMVHIGDRPHNDIDGAHAAGAKAVLLTAVKDRGSEGAGADAVCRSYAELPEVIARLNDSISSGKGVWGLAETLQAVLEKRVLVLVVHDQYRAPGSECPRCRLLLTVQEGTCPSCGGRLEPVEDVVDAALERAVTQEAELELVRSPVAQRMLPEREPIGAVLRF